ncbi:hypothetical protein ADIAL_0661 [Alkalibacterium sp. AK22]|uniref:hypothetical protein n=1 Tax=Alkalibacterium sp. AK22 TaxID=1229520 RepID=UPI00044A6EA3|nr:hypothetical protein [Alkalibacterium sp. AK22]EXJ23869.1 hypothetical protein ADIAL_0661 [Alkalibacterium sp. AK22]
MSSQKKILIYEVLDMFNEEVGFKGLDNTGKVTNERDDVIDRHNFNHYVDEYNKTHERKIKPRKLDQYHNEWFKSDIQKLISDTKVQKKIKSAYKRKTVPILDDWGLIGQSSMRVSKKYKQHHDELIREGNITSFEESIEGVIKKLIDEVINEYFQLFLKDDQIEVLKYLNRDSVVEDFINMNLVEEEAFRIVDSNYCNLEYNETGEVIAIHGSRPKINLVNLIISKEK